MKTTDSTIQLCKPLDVLNMCTKTIIFIIPMNELKKIVYVFHWYFIIFIVLYLYEEKWEYYFRIWPTLSIFVCFIACCWTCRIQKRCILLWDSFSKPSAYLNSESSTLCLGSIYRHALLKDVLFRNTKYISCGGNTRNAIILIKINWCTWPFFKKVTYHLVILLYLHLT